MKKWLSYTKMCMNPLKNPPLELAPNQNTSKINKILGARLIIYGKWRKTKEENLQYNISGQKQVSK